jgi:hypothetical protein
MADVSKCSAKRDAAVERLAIDLLATVIAGVIVAGVLDHTEEPSSATHLIVVGGAPVAL